jgi:hypothetical protein
MTSNSAFTIVWQMASLKMQGFPWGIWPYEIEEVTSRLEEEAMRYWVITFRGRSPQRDIFWGYEFGRSAQRPRALWDRASTKTERLEMAS